MNNHAFDLQSVKNIDVLPPMPATAKAIVDSFADDLISLEEISDVISQDPAISSRILGLANSAFFSANKEILTVKEAIISVLGLDLTRGVAIGIACADAFDSTECPRFDIRRFWQSSLVASSLAHQFSKRLKSTTEYSDECAITGLLHGLGYLCLATADGAQFNSVLAADEPDDAIEDHYGAPHQAIALTLTQSWELPTCVQAYFEASAAKSDQDPQHRLVDVAIHVAVGVADDKPADALIESALESLGLDVAAHSNQLSKAVASSVAAAAFCA